MNDLMPNPRIICSTGSFAGHSLGSRFRLLREAGFDGAELLLTPRLIHADPRALRDLEDQYRLPIRSVHCVLRLRPASPRQLAGDIAASARLAAELRQCRVLVVHPPPVDSLHEPAALQWLQSLEQASEIAAGSGFVVAVENMGQLTRRPTTSAFDHPSRLKWLAEEWNVSLTFDATHAASRDWDILQVADFFGERIANLHLSDLGGRSYPWALANALLRDHRVPGEGTLPLQALLAQLATRGYARLITLELSPVAIRSWWPPAIVGRLRAAALASRPHATLSEHSSPHSSGPEARA